MARKRKELTDVDFYNWWLQKYHNTTIEEIIEKEPELAKTAEWYKKYAVTSEQHDEWFEWALQTVMKHYRWSKKIAKKQFCFDYLNVSPSIKKETD
jgi:hypothetical protein